mmetsp:Transcript_36982/g.81256  ORF Transcript_36982/g.81256 Transcript_36982/m.81256 type:complete len:232 (-) Transcript_36982:994-1689(-)|eukprot:3886287-Pleurochrysis_carterae.AAC.8
MGRDGARIAARLVVRLSPHGGQLAILVLLARHRALRLPPRLVPPDKSHRQPVDKHLGHGVGGGALKLTHERGNHETLLLFGSRAVGVAREHALQQLAKRLRRRRTRHRGRARRVGTPRGAAALLENRLLQRAQQRHRVLAQQDGLRLRQLHQEARGGGARGQARASHEQVGELWQDGLRPRLVHHFEALLQRGEAVRVTHGLDTRRLERLLAHAHVRRLQLQVVEHRVLEA